METKEFSENTWTRGLYIENGEGLHSIPDEARGRGAGCVWWVFVCVNRSVCVWVSRNTKKKIDFISLGIVSADSFRALILNWIAGLVARTCRNFTPAVSLMSTFRRWQSILNFKKMLIISLINTQVTERPGDLFSGYHSFKPFMLKRVLYLKRPCTSLALCAPK